MTPSSGQNETEVDDLATQAVILFEELVSCRDRIAGLPLPTSLDFEHANQAMHELVWYLLTPPKGARTGLQLPDTAKAQLTGAARDRSIDLYALTIALLAQKMSSTRPNRQRDLVAAALDSLDGLAFDYRRPKKDTLSLLRELREAIDSRVAYVRAHRRGGFEFREKPETYAARREKRERPDAFFNRVYARLVPRGLTQADIRRVDPAFYNVLHVWCSRNKRKLSGFLPPTRERVHR
jgi:hypothetical protein